MSDWFSQFDMTFFYKTLLPKFITTLGIIVGALIIVKLVGKVLARWQKTLLKRVSKKDPRNYATVSTRVTVIKRIIIISIYFFAFILIFLQFEALRNLGTGLLASAGVAGVVIGMAAQSTLSDMLAGIAISFSQPVRLNDAIIFDNEFGWVEEISLMHVIIKTWDNRRIVVPNSVFSNQVIQNWTLRDPALLGIVIMYVDYTCSLDQIKGWVKDIVESSDFASEEKVAVVQIVDFTEKSMKLRMLAKGPDAPKTWSLRCEIREKLMAKFQEARLPLPRIRIDQGMCFSDKRDHSGQSS